MWFLPSVDDDKKEWIDMLKNLPAYDSYGMGFDYGSGSSKTVWYQWTRHDDGSVSWRLLGPEDAYFCSITEFHIEPDPPKLAKLQPKSKPWVAMNNRPAWLGRRK